jgi:hypothetical protein
MLVGTRDISEMHFIGHLTNPMNCSCCYMGGESCCKIHDASHAYHTSEQWNNLNEENDENFNF